MKRANKFFCLSLGISLSILVGIIYLTNKNTPGFNIEKISSSFEPNLKWAIPNQSKADKADLSKILFQDFNYLGSGAECFAFLSADEKYVLKFFKIKHLVPKNWLKILPLPGLEQYRFKKIDQRILRHHELFSSYKMAYEELKEESGLVYIHLNKTKDLRMKIRLFDRMRRCFKINLDDYEFVLQKKGQLIHERLIALMQKEDQEGAIEAIRALINHVVARCKKGFIDRDSEINHNYGFVGNKVIHFDLGRIIRDETAQNPSSYQREILRVGKNLEVWLSLHYPELLPDLEELINNMINPSENLSQSESISN